MGGKFAMNGTVVQKSGNGYYDGTKSQGYAYYLGMGYQVNDQHRLEAYLMGAPQRHGHNLYEVNAAVADADFAKNELGFQIMQWITLKARMIITRRNTIKLLSQMMASR